MGDLSSILGVASTWILPVLIAVTFHEAAHGWVAWRLGDDTAYARGRVTFNPLAHVDPVGTVLVPGMLVLTGAPFLFGWAKPVPVNFMALRRPRRDMVWVALAGPGINIALAIIAAALLHTVDWFPATAREFVELNLAHAFLINVVLAVFNMLPLPPLDGGRVAVGLLPPSLSRPLARLERWGFFIILGAIFVVPYLGRLIGYDINIFSMIIGLPVSVLIDVIVALVGLN